jgi:hypothetical protein
MEKRESTPNRRASEAKQEVTRVRRRYKKNITRQARLLPGEIPGVQNMVAILHLAHYPKSQIARIIGISKQQVQEFLDDPAVSEMLSTIRTGLPNAALDLMEGYMIEAVQAIVDVMRVSGDDALVLKAASEILDRTGLPKISKSERHQTNEEQTTITDDGLIERLREASPEIQEQAAQVVEKLEGLLAQAAAESAGGDDEDV